MIKLSQFFLENRTILLWGEIDEKLSRRVISQLLYFSHKSNDDIYLLINSDGGSTFESAAIIGQMEIVKEQLNLHTVVMGKAFSCAADIATCGTKSCRHISSFGLMMFHEASLDLPLDYFAKQETFTSFQKKQNEEIDKMIAANCKKKYANFVKARENGLWLDAQQSIKFCAVDKIWTGLPKLDE